MLLPTTIPTPFLHLACDILGDTNSGLSGSEIVRAFLGYADEYDVSIPHTTYPFDAPNKRTALFQNLAKFKPEQQFRILRDLCNHPKLSPAGKGPRTDLKTKLFTRYSHLSSEPSVELDASLVDETKHWLQPYPDVLKLYMEAFHKLDSGVFNRNLLDDLRLALEKLLQSLLKNGKSLENQLQLVGTFIKDHGGSVHVANMFHKLLDYYTKYQNTYVKHDDAVIEAEIEFVFEITSSFMKHLIRLGAGKG